MVILLEVFADIAESGIDAGRALPQKAPSEPWWKGIAGTFQNQADKVVAAKPRDPPRPKSLEMYNFGSPRAGNRAFAKQFQEFIDKGYIDAGYRIVNAQDIIARAPRPMGIMNVDYEHCGKTVLIEEDDEAASEVDADPKRSIWIEGESDFDRIDPVRDLRSMTTGILSEGTLLDDLGKAYTGETEEIRNGVAGVFDQLGAVANRLQKADIADLTSVVGIDKNYANREIQLAQSFLKGESLAHHLEDSYFSAMGRAVGFNTTIGEEIVRL